MTNYGKLSENPSRKAVYKKRACFWGSAFAAILGLSLTACLDVEGEWGVAPGTGLDDNEPGSGLSLAERLRVIHTDAASGSEHTITLTGGGNIGAQDLTFSGRSDITIHLVGDGKERTISLTDNGSLFTIGSGVTLILDNWVTLWGRSGNNAPLISVGANGLLIMKAGSKVSNNHSGGTAGIYVATGGSFIMEGGEISGNSSSRWSDPIGGVSVASGADFLMKSGKITGNTGIGLYVEGRLTMTNGEISHNTAPVGGGMYISGGDVTMSGGRIFGNTASTTSTSYGGGGVYVSGATFTMSGGEIAFNTAPSGGGVFVAGNAHIKKTGGTIYGYVIGNNNRNTATDGISGNNKGHAVFVNSSPSKRRETTAGTGLNLDSEIPGAAGGWE